jgi:hypothetical protein
MEKEIIKLPIPPKAPLLPKNKYFRDLKYKCEKEQRQAPSYKEACKEFKAMDASKKARYFDEAEMTKYKKEVEDYNRILQSKGYAERAEYGAPEIESALIISGLSSETYSVSKGVCSLIGKYIGHAIYNLADKIKVMEGEKVPADMIFAKVEVDSMFELIKKSKYYKEVIERLENDKKLKEENRKKALERKLKKEEEEKSGKSSEEVSKKKKAKKKKSN